MPNDLKKRYEKIQKSLDQLFPKVTTALNYKTPFELLVAVILSAQTTDVRVNKITEKLFKKYKKPEDFAKANLKELEKDIYGVNFYKNKAKSLKKMAEIVQKEHKNKVPNSLEELVKLPGVARKTANVVLGHAYKIASGIVVDTHVKRVANRLGLTKNADPVKIEQDLMAIIPKQNWIKFGDQLIWYGRKYCTAKQDKCKLEGIDLEHF